MNVLFVHAHAPGQYGHLAARLAADPANTVVFLAREGDGAGPGVHLRRFAPHRAAKADAHPYLAPLETAVLNGQAAWRAARALRAEGFVPDIVCAHAGFGPGMYVKEAFPEAPLLGYFEWFYRAEGSDADFLLGPLDPDNACRLRTLNAGILLELSACDWGTCPTSFQRGQFPAAFQDKLTTLHDGVDTGFFCPDPADGTVVGGVDLSGAAEVVTYATRGMDPYRGFPQFLEAAADLLAERPGLHVVIAGDEGVPYGPRRKDGRSYKAAGLDALAGRDLSRLHFTGTLGLADYRRLLRLSTVHAYLTVPFVLSWSLLEAMATGCAIVASDTAPVREVVDDGVEGLLTPFRDVPTLVGRITTLLDDCARRTALGHAARARVLRDYRLEALLPRQLRLIHNLVESRACASVSAKPAEIATKFEPKKAGFKYSSR